MNVEALNFVCTSCGETFHVHLDEYRGEFDHPDDDCRCDECKEKEGHFVGRRWHSPKDKQA